MKDIVIGFLATICILFLVFGGIVLFPNKSANNSKSEIKFNKQEVEQILFETRIEHPGVVLAQIILESDSMQSKIAVDNNNILGMKMPAQRPTLAIGIKNGHAEYKSIRDCILDYIIFQQIYYRNLSEEEYIDKLAKDYAQDPNYKEKLLKIISQ